MSDIPKQIDTGGPAYPSQPLDPQGGATGPLDTGMTLRDHFAGIALSAIIALESDAGIKGEVHDAYLYADEMIAAGEAQS